VLKDQGDYSSDAVLSVPGKGIKAGFPACLAKEYPPMQTIS